MASKLEPLEAEKVEESHTPTTSSASVDTAEALSVDPVEKEDRSTIPLHDEIDKRVVNKVDLPPALDLQSLDVSKCNSVSILITGKTGSGKSTLTNGILGLKVEDERAAKVGGDVERCTTQIKKCQAKKGKIEVTVWDSPGLQDGTKDQEKYLREMKCKCEKRDLTIYCIKILDVRFVRGDDNPDVLAMKKLTETFGVTFWKSTVIVLTFANTLEAVNEDWEDLSEEEKGKAFTEKIQQWKEQVRTILEEDINVPAEIVRAIRVIPAAGRKPHLPGCRYWLSVLWFTCVDTITTQEGRFALVKMNAHRLTEEKQVTGIQFKCPSEKQPIVVSLAIVEAAGANSNAGSYAYELALWMYSLYNAIKGLISRVFY